MGRELAAAGMKPRVRVLSGVEMNAFALPNGAVYLHTATLARMSSEAQLAALLGHEYCHVLYHHGLRKHRNVKSRATVAAAVGVAATAASNQYARMGATLVELAAISSIYGFSRDAEREADREGLERMARRGYDLEGAVGMLQTLRDYQDELGAQGLDRDPPPYLFSTHPRLEERIADTRDLIAERGGTRGGIVAAEEFAGRVESVRVHHAGMEIEAGRLESAQVTSRLVLDRNPNHAPAWGTLGQALVVSGEANEPAAREAFQRALEIDPGMSSAHRSLGMMHYRDWRKHDHPDADAAAALAHFDRYLNLEDDAPDRAYVARYVREMQAAQPPSVSADAIAP